MIFELSKWEFKPILMNLEYRTKDKNEFIKNLMALIELLGLTKEIKITENNVFEYIHIHELENNLTNKDLLDFLNIDIFKKGVENGF